MRASTLLIVSLAACAGCGSELPDDQLNPVRAHEIPHVVSAQEALDTSQISTLDPQTMNDAEISKVLGESSFCAFRYVTDGNPVLAWRRQPNGSSAVAVVKINGVLVGLQNEANKSSNAYVAGDVRLILVPSDSNQTLGGSVEHPQDARLIFEVDQQLRVGYGGYAVCPT